MSNVSKRCKKIGQKLVGNVSERCKSGLTYRGRRCLACGTNEMRSIFEESKVVFEDKSGMVNRT